MKKITLIALMLFTALGYAQVGINTNNPDASSALEIESTTGGILIPRLTETQRDAITEPATGLMIYQTNQTTGFYFFDGTVWTKIDGVAGPQGETGLAGPAGIQGAQGEAGSQGIQGIQGETGATGPAGPQGPQGIQGVAGADGTNGSDGADGKGISSTVDNGDGTFTITYTNNTTFTTSDFTGPTGATGPQGPQGETVPANSAIITNSYNINDIEGLNDGDLVFNTSSHKLYIYMDPSMTTTDLYSGFLNNNTTSSTTNTSNTSYIISFQVSKRIEIARITLSDGGSYPSAKPYIFEDNNNINDGLGTRIYSYLSSNENPNLILSPDVTYRILYIGYSSSNSITCSNINNYDYDSSLFLNLQTHKTSDITVYYSIPEAYTVEVTNTIPNFSDNADYKHIFNFSAVNNLLLIGL